MVRARPKLSNAPPLRMTSPIRDARDNPETIATGAANSSGHGVATTRKATARTADPLSAHARPAIAIAIGSDSGSGSGRVSVGEPDDRRARGTSLTDHSMMPA